MEHAIIDNKTKTNRTLTTSKIVKNLSNILSWLNGNKSNFYLLHKMIFIRSEKEIPNLISEIMKSAKKNKVGRSMKELFIGIKPRECDLNIIDCVDAAKSTIESYIDEILEYGAVNMKPYYDTFNMLYKLLFVHLEWKPDPVIKVAKKIEDMIEKPGSLRKHFNLKDDEKIPIGKAREELKELRKKAKEGNLSKSELSLLRKLSLFLNVLRPASKKGE